MQKFDIRITIDIEFLLLGLIHWNLKVEDWSLLKSIKGRSYIEISAPQTIETTSSCTTTV